MFVNLPVPEDIPNDLVPLLLSKDRHEMLDELIRRTGTGIDLKTVRREAIPAKDKNKLYLGLNVHGKKRADLARKHSTFKNRLTVSWRVSIVRQSKML